MLLALSPRPAPAHVLAPRLNIDGFVRRANAIVRGRVETASRPVDPARGPYPVGARVTVERVLKGQGLPGAITVLGWDDHAIPYQPGQRAVFFLQGRPGQDAELVSDQQQGEAIFVTGEAEAAAWDAYLEVSVRAVARGPDLWSAPGYDAALRAALVAPAPTLRAHALRQMSLRLQTPRFERADLDALLAAYRTRSLPPAERTALLNLALRFLSPADVAVLAEDASESAEVRGPLFGAWAYRVHAAGDRADQDRARAGLRSALGGPLRVEAAAALARLSDPAGLDALAGGLRNRKTARSSVAGLELLARGGHREAHRALLAARDSAPDGRTKAWIEAALKGLGPPPPPERRMAEYVAAASGALALVAVGLLLWRRRRRMHERKLPSTRNEQP